MARMFRPGWGEQYPGIHGLYVAQGSNDALYVSARPHLNFEEWANSIVQGTRNSNIFNYHVYLPDEPVPQFSSARNIEWLQTK